MAEKKEKREPKKVWEEELFKDYIARMIAEGKLTEEEACIGLMTMDCRGLQGRG